MIVIMDMFRSLVRSEEISQDQFNEYNSFGDFKCDISVPGMDIYSGPFYPISEESMDFETDRIFAPDGTQRDDITIFVPVFLN